ncbi:hypothetical protein EIP86_005304 [Pleurotus ostreatoroseus]|nr:hypothetical protein EIP86_005304 [Pleurotus ostreatoroseus]
MNRFKGSDDYLRQKFDEYISGALSCVKYADFLAKGQSSGVGIDGAGNPNAPQDFNMLWISEFKKTNAYEVWDRVTDSMLFDIVEPRHPCSERPSVVADISLRLSEGIQDLKLDQQLAPAREAVSRTITAGSTSFFKAVEGVRDRWMQRTSSVPESSISASSSLVDVSKSDAASTRSGRASIVSSPETSPQPPASKIRPLSLVGSRSLDSSPQPPPVPAPAARSSLSSWGAGISSFFAQRSSRTSMSQPNTNTTPTPPRDASPAPSVSTTKSRVESYTPPMDLGVEELHPKNLDEVYSAGSGSSAGPDATFASSLQASADKDAHTTTATHTPRKSTSTLGSAIRSDGSGEHEYEGTGFAL